MARQVKTLSRIVWTLKRSVYVSAAARAAESDNFPDAQKKLTFVEQDSDALFAVFEKRKKQLWNALGPSQIDSIHHIGSSAIRGMPGSPMVDMIMFVHTWPPSDNITKTLEDLKFVSLGDAPHQADDKWYKFVEEGGNMQELGSGVLHVLHKDHEEAHATQILFVEYCNNDKEAFEAYKAIKLKAKEAGSFGDYKKKKVQLIQDLLPKAAQWKKEQDEKQK